jgi:hypothetical protein
MRFSTNAYPVLALLRLFASCLGSMYLQSPPSAQLHLVWHSILNCLRISVSSMNLIAFMAALRSVNMSRRLCRPGMLPSSWRWSCRYLRHRSRTCDTVWRLSLHGQLASVASGTPRLKRKSLSPIFSVRSWTRTALCRLLNRRAVTGSSCGLRRVSEHD